MKYTIKDFADKALIPYTDFYNQALKLFQTIHFYGSEGVAEPILNNNDVIVDFKMTHAFGVAVVAILDATTNQEDLVSVIHVEDFA